MGTTITIHSESSSPRNTESKFLYPYQYNAVERMSNGCILNGGVGSGKSRTSLYYYFRKNGGDITDDYYAMPSPQNLYIITTAMKRDKHEWENELVPFLLSPYNTIYQNTVVIDSWNNIAKYVDVKGSFFIFDEDRVTGYGKWVKAFLKIAKVNDWIILSATPGDKWEDYIPVFIANGFYRNKTEFNEEHLSYDPHCKNYPRVIGYRNTGRLIRLRNRILVSMDFERQTVPHHEDVYVRYDIAKYKDAFRTRTNPYIQGYIPCMSNSFGALKIGIDISLKDVDPILEGVMYEPKEGEYVRWTNKPLQDAGGLCRVLRRIVNEDESRQVALLELLEDHPRAIIFYNYDYEREILLNLGYSSGTEVAEWSGHAHQEIPVGDKFVYLVQYTAGAEGWNTLRTDTVIFYSQSYSYRAMIQAAGRIDRLNTPFKDLYYYHFKTRSGIDLAITQALSKKKDFNEGKFIKW